MTQTIIITGPSGAGKSTVALAVAEQMPDTWAFISQDGMREHIKAGYCHADVEWTDETRRQWEVSITICCDMVKRYHEANISCVVEMFAPPSEFEKWKQQLKGFDYKLVVLLPDVQKTVDRNANRELKMKEEKIRENHEWFTKWEPTEAIIIDSSNLSVDETVERVKELVTGSVD